MPKPLTEEPDVEPIHKQVIRLAAQAHTDRKRPVRVRFSSRGYHRALQQTVPGMDPWGTSSYPPTHYLGLPFTEDRDQREDVTLDTEPR